MTSTGSTISTSSTSSGSTETTAEGTPVTTSTIASTTQNISTTQQPTSITTIASPDGDSTMIIGVSVAASFLVIIAIAAIIMLIIIKRRNIQVCCRKKKSQASPLPIPMPPAREQLVPVHLHNAIRDPQTSAYNGPFQQSDENLNKVDNEDSISNKSNYIEPLPKEASVGSDTGVYVPMNSMKQSPIPCTFSKTPGYVNIDDKNTSDQIYQNVDPAKTDYVDETSQDIYVNDSVTNYANSDIGNNDYINAPKKQVQIK